MSCILVVEATLSFLNLRAILTTQPQEPWNMNVLDGEGVMLESGIFRQV